MDIIFEKIPFENYLAFFETKNPLSIEDRYWLRIQYDYLKEPVEIQKNTYEFYCPDNISVQKGNPFAIPTGYKCVSGGKKASCIPMFKFTRTIPLSREDLSSHIVIRGTLNENHCFQTGDKLVKLIFEE